MPEAQAPRHVRRADQVARKQHVERVERYACGLLPDRDREVELERLPDERAGLEQRARLRGKAAELDRQRSDHGAWHCDVVMSGLAAVHTPALTGPRELLEVEGVPAADRPEPACAGGIRPHRQQRDRIRLAERPELDALDEPAPGGGLECGRHAPAALPRTVCERQHEAARSRPAQHVREHLDRGLVGPVHVVEDQQQAVPGRQALQQAGHRLVSAKASRAAGSTA